MTFLNMLVCAVALSAGGMPLPGLAYGKTTRTIKDSLTRVGSVFERMGKPVAARIPTDLPMEMTFPETPTEVHRSFPLVRRSHTVVEEGVPHLPSKTGEDIAKILRDIPDAIEEPYDLEYLGILAEIDRKHSHYKLSHRDLQWKICAELLNTLDSNEDRVDFVTAVRRYPFHRRLPATVAISPKIHELWVAGRALFLERIREKGANNGN